MHSTKTYCSNLAASLSIIASAGLVGCGGGGSQSATENIAAMESGSSEAASPSESEPSAVVVFSEQPDARTQAPFARFVFASSTEEFECRSDNNSVFEPCESPHTLLPLAAGDHEFAVRAVSDDGVAGDPSTIQWTVLSIFPDGESPTAHTDLVETAVQPDATASNSWRGILRLNCDFAHSNYDDPIVFPGETGAAHLHRFYGNTLVDANSTYESLFTEGESSCQGNTLNRSAYWIPALLAPAYDPATEARLFDRFGEPAFKAVPAVVGNDDEAHEVFYYSAGVDELTSIKTIPSGLVMIAGDHMGQPGNEQDFSVARWHCQSWESSDANNPRWSSSIPECFAPDRLRLDIFFPSCWNGFDLDSYDHKTHLAYPNDTGGDLGTVCPDSHPVPIIRVSYHYAFGVKPDVFDPKSSSSRGWVLASDMYQTSTAQPGGMSLHGDWFNAWHPEALEAVLKHCIQSALDCHDGNLANGYRLSGTREGSQLEPSIITDGV